MLRFWKRSEAAARRLGILPAAFNPVTAAHLEMARQGAAQYRLDEVLFLLPFTFPHKEFEGASFEQRLEMLEAALAAESRFSIGSTAQGLFIGCDAGHQLLPLIVGQAVDREPLHQPFPTIIRFVVRHEQ